MNAPTPEIRLPEPRLPKLVPRDANSHKGSFGNALLIGGSRGMAGSIAMAGLAAARSGAGLVRLAVPNSCLETVAGFSPCAMTIPLGDNASGQMTASLEDVLPWIEKATCVGIGPGIGRSHHLEQLLKELLPRVSCPLVIDADALNNLAMIPDWPNLANKPIVLTPHPGEWARLCGVDASQPEQQITTAITFADTHGMVVVLKGHRTLVTDGQTIAFNTSGTPAMATGGSGDVLTGMIVALICQGLGARDAAQLAVFVHGMAGEIAEREQRSHVVLPTELIEFLPRGFEAAANLPDNA